MNAWDLHGFSQAEAVIWALLWVRIDTVADFLAACEHGL